MNIDKVATRRVSMTGFLTPPEPAAAWRGTAINIRFHATFPMPAPPNISSSLTMMRMRRE